MLATVPDRFRMLFVMASSSQIGALSSVLLPKVLLSKVDIPWSAKFGIEFGILISTTFSLFFLHLWAEAFVCVSASNVDRSDLLL